MNDDDMNDDDDASKATEYQSATVASVNAITEGMPLLEQNHIEEKNDNMDHNLHNGTYTVRFSDPL